MKQRIITGVLYAAVLLLVLIFRRWLLAPALEIAALLCCFEMLRAFNKKGLRPAKVLTLICAALPVPACFLGGGSGAFAFCCFALFLLLVCHLFRASPSLPDTASALLSATYASVPLALLCAVLACGKPCRRRPAHRRGIPLCLCRGCARLFFRLPLWQAPDGAEPIPEKTWEGAAGGILGSLLTGSALYGIGRYLSAPFVFWHMILLALFCAVAEQVGDLTASLIKRYCGVKDYGNLFPGHGGMMDRMDSVFFTAFAVYVYCHLAAFL